VTGPSYPLLSLRRRAAGQPEWCGPRPSTARGTARVAGEQRLGRALDYAVIVPRPQLLYQWSARELGEPDLLELIRDGSPIYAWPYEQRHVWRTADLPLVAKVVERLTRVR
jgi:hypothetical protein